jgi:hypothetical protein
VAVAAAVLGALVGDAGLDLVDAGGLEGVGEGRPGGLAAGAHGGGRIAGGGAGIEQRGHHGAGSVLDGDVGVVSAPDEVVAGEEGVAGDDVTGLCFETVGEDGVAPEVRGEG